jgi:threonine/homoserine/homoserine lactone efflux protein
VLVIVTPGQDTALTVKNALFGGRRAGVLTALGVSTGQLVWALATSVGLAALVVASEPVFVAIRVLGAVYLVVLGARALFAAVRRQAGGAAQNAGAKHGLRPAVAFRQGLISNLANPKMAAFFTSLLPQAVAAESASFLPLFALGLAFCFLTLVWLTAYALAVARASDILRRSWIRRLLDAVTGIALVAFGVRLATERQL